MLVLGTLRQNGGDRFVNQSTGVNRKAIFFLASLGTFMAALDSSIVNVSIPAIMTSYKTNIAEVEWVISSYMIGFAAWMPLTAWARDRIGNLWLYVTSVAIFTISSALCGAAPTLDFLVGSRVFQALGGGALTPTAMAMIADVYPREERARVLGWWGLIAVLGPAMGPTLGGILTENWGWPAIFYVNVPVGILIIGASFRYIPRAKPVPENQQAFQYVSFLALLMTTISLLYGVSKAPRSGLTGDVGLSFALSVVGGALFYGHWRRKGTAILDLDLFSYRDFRFTMILTVLRSLTLYGTTFLVPIYLQGPRGLSETVTGLVLGAGALVLALTMPISGRVLTRTGIKGLVTSGVAVVAIYCFACFFWNTQTTISFLVMTLILRGIGIGLMVTPLSTLAINSVPASKAGMASSILSLIQQLAGALGVALFAGAYDVFLHYTSTSSTAFDWTFLFAGVLVLAAIPLAMRLPRSAF